MIVLSEILLNKHSAIVNGYFVYNYFIFFLKPQAAGPGRVAVAMIGKFGIAGSFAIAYLYPAEIFPTPIR